MKQPLLQILTGVALVSAGVWAGSTFNRDDSGPLSVNHSLTPSNPEVSGARHPGTGQYHQTGPTTLTKRTFKKGGALEWLRSQNSLGDITALEEILGKFSAGEFGELNEALLQEIKDDSRPEHKRRFAVRLLQSMWP